MKIRLEQLNPIIGDITGNVAKLQQAMAGAEKDDIDLLVFSELIVCGYSPMDLLERSDFLKAVYDANDQIVAQSGRTGVLFGTLTENSGSGRKCFNSAILARNGRKIAEVHKTLLPTYDVYDELRYFEPGDRSFDCIEFQGIRIGVTICEDIWHNFNLPYLTYDVSPAEELVAKGAQAIFNLSASPFSRNKPADRREMLTQRAEKLKVPVFYTNQVGGNTDLVSDGDSLAVNSRAEVVGWAPLFKEAFVDFSWNIDDKTALNDTTTDVVKINGVSEELPGKTGQVFQALVKGLKDYLRKTRVTDKIVLGLSGGVDSALVCAIAVEALGAEKVVGITMPSEYSSEGSVSHSQQLADNLGIELVELAIKDIFEQFARTLKPLFEGSSFGVAEENLQPRIRSALLMAYANKFNFILLNTGNKSELATGYCTLYGDMSGGLGVISDLYKTEVYKMADWLNTEYFGREVIPNEILIKPPSAELRPDQKDSDSLPEYEVLDPILQAYIEDQQSIEEIAGQGFDIEVVRQVVALVDRMEYKRAQSAPGLRLTAKAFGSGRRWPLVQQWTDNQMAGE